MIYNRYIPGSNGVYHVERICSDSSQETKHSPKEEDTSAKKHAPFRENNAASGPDLGDMLLICIGLLLLMDCDSEDTLPLLIAITAFVFLH